MSNKTSKNLLNESQVRQFMKLAQLEPLTPGFITGLAERRETRPPGGLALAGHGRSDKTIPDSNGQMRHEEADPAALEDYATGDEERGEDEEALDDEIEADEEEISMDDDAAADGDRTVNVDDFLAALENALEAAMGEEVEVDASAMEDDEDPEAEMDIDADIDMGAGEDIDMDADEELMEAAKEDDDDDDEKNESTEATDELVEQITKRVAARILKAALKK